MSTITCTRRLTFAAGHRVLNHEGKCAHPHGHNYVVEITAKSNGLDKVGRVIDFAVLKAEIGGWIDKKWDHGFIAYRADTALIRALAPLAFPAAKVFEAPWNPTAENMADYLLHNVCPALLKGSGIRVVRVKLWETENCYATATVRS